jgi:hypothetical protein
MNGFLDKLFHGRWIHQATGIPDRAYVSDFTHFIDDFLGQHPEVTRDQKTGRLIYWEKKVDLAAQEKAEKDSVPDDGYGFYYSGWGRNRKH